MEWKKHVESLLDYSQSHPFNEKRIVVDGFAFHFYWNDKSNYFEVRMFFNVGWGHSTGFWCRTKEEFFDKAELLIKDARKIYTNGGGFSSDYYKD